jgi:hypothetical protein
VAKKNITSYASYADEAGFLKDDPNDPNHPMTGLPIGLSHEIILVKRLAKNFITRFTMKNTRLFS